MAQSLSPLQRIFIGLVRFYQCFISPLLGPRCRFHPTCSTYAVDAIQKHGVLRGCILIGKRLLKCHPMHSGGVDLVPEPKQKK